MNNRFSDDTSTDRSGIRFGVILLPVVILGAVGAMVWFVFLGPQMRHDRLSREGIRMEGTILDIEETGTVVNDHPELEITVAVRRPNGTVDTASTDYIPDFSEIGLLHNGAQVQIAVDSSDPKDFTLIAIGGPQTGPASGLNQDPLKSTSMSDSLQKVIQRLQDSLSRAIHRRK